MTIGSSVGEASAGGRRSGTTPGRLWDRGAVFAGYVGLGMALVIAIAFELIIAVQPLVFLVAPIAGVLIGGYANQRSERWRPLRRVFANATYAGLVTGIALAVMYVLLRLLFIFADTGSLPTGRQLTCDTGPDCTYQRYVLDGRGDELAAAGITDGASFGAYAVREQLVGGGIIVVVTLGGAWVGAGVRGIQRVPPNGVAGSAGVG